MEIADATDRTWQEEACRRERITEAQYVQGLIADAKATIETTIKTQLEMLERERHGLIDRRDFRTVAQAAAFHAECLVDDFSDCFNGYEIAQLERDAEGNA